MNYKTKNKRINKTNKKYYNNFQIQEISRINE